MALGIEIDRKKLGDFCRKWKIAEVHLFGSVLRDDFRPDSDVDLLITPAPDARWTLFKWVEMEDELSELLGRKAEISDRRAIERSQNEYRRKEILGTAVKFDVA